MSTVCEWARCEWARERKRETGMKLSCIKPKSKVRGLSIEPRVPAQVALINACI